jgi:hypothetical protein
MKKRRFFTIGLLAIGLVFTGCNDDDDDDTFDPVLGPSLEVSELNNGVTGGGDLTINQGESLRFAIAADEGAEDMDEITISITGANVTANIPESSEGNVFENGTYSLNGSEEEMFRDTLEFLDAGTQIGVTNYTFTVNDDNGASSSVTYTVTVESSADLVTSDFTWQRTGNTDGTGLDQFGLAWEDNLDIGGEVSAIVKTDEATVFVQLDAEDWLIDNSGELTMAINDADSGGDAIPAQGYTNVSAEQDDNYDDYLGVIYLGEPYILHIQEADVASVSAGTQITIMGQYKN